MDSRGRLYSDEEVKEMSKKKKESLLYVDESIRKMNRKERRAYYKKHKRMPCFDKESLFALISTRTVKELKKMTRVSGSSVNSNRVRLPYSSSRKAARRPIPLWNNFSPIA